MNSDALQAGLPPANDRMLTTCFVAALFHAIVILGVTFSSSASDAGGPEAPALEVVLVNDQAPRAERNPTARYIAQRTQLGSGNTLADERSLIPRSSIVPIDRNGSLGGQGLASLQAGPEEGGDEVLWSHAPTQRVIYFASTSADPTADALAPLLRNSPDLGMAPNDDGIELRMRGEPRRQLWVAADARESDVAVYLDSWRRKIERVGTMNFPDVARRERMSGTPVIEVTIGADGRLLKTVIRRSSGHAELDAAAMRILKLAAPYDRFPAAMNAKHDEIRIAYEWQFLGGAAEGSGVFYADPAVAAPSNAAPPQ